MNIKTFDLNLLKVFAAIYKERNVSRAALAVGLSQPAVSNALQRLRRTCNDPLFVRVTGGVMPTALAEELAAPVEQAMLRLEQAFENRLGFDPRYAERRFRLLTSDVGERTLLPLLMRKLAAEAPGVCIEAAQIPHEQYRDVLQDGRADLAIGHLDFLKSGFHQQHLFDDSYCCVASKRHPRFRDRISLADFVAAQHVSVVSGNADGQVERELARLRLRRSISLQVTHYHTAVEVVASSTLIATIPRQALKETKGIRAFAMPLNLQTADVRQFWHRRMHHNPAHRWLRGLLFNLLGSA
ncbi:MAG: LysR family transcriptional regulator [Burkholderiales bacterium]|nr:LysR family transcriptional regulator [Burkholderiales bacterium]ODU62397.1 MAG: transcriptional regulator [Lautropia sp. SCN 66-9]